jgi:hypothetical protein
MLRQKSKEIIGMISMRGGFKSHQNLAITWLVFFMPFFVLELCSDKKGHKKDLNKIEVLMRLGGE